MSNPETDGDFDFYLRFVKPLVLNLKEPNDRALAAAWVQKLRDENAGTEELRTDYLKLLLFVLQRKKLIGVFSENPNQYEVLEKFPETNLHDVARELLEAEEDCRRQQNLGRAGGDFPAYSTEHSADLLEYSAAQDIPNFGVHAYYAISNEPLPKWERTEKAVFPRGYSNNAIISNTTKEPDLGVASTTDRHMRSDVLSRTSSTTSEPTLGDKDHKGKRHKPKKKSKKDEEAKPDEKGYSRGFDGGKTSPRRKSFGSELPSPPLGSKAKDSSRDAPTWGSNLIGVTELPVRDIPTESLEQLSDQGSSDSTVNPSVPYRDPSPEGRDEGDLCLPCDSNKSPRSPPYSPGFPEGQASVFFLESPPGFLEDASLAGVSPVRRSPSPKQIPSSQSNKSPRSPPYSPGFPEGHASEFFLESPPGFLEDASLAGVSPVRRSPSPKQIPSSQIGGRKYDLDELKNLELDAEPVQRTHIDNDLDAFDRMIDEYEKDDYVPPSSPILPARSPSTALAVERKPSKKVVTRKKTVKKAGAVPSRSGAQQPTKTTKRVVTKTTSSTAPGPSSQGSSRISAPGALRAPGSSTSRITAPGARVSGSTTSRAAAPGAKVPGSGASRIDAPGAKRQISGTSRTGATSSTRAPGTSTSRTAASGGSRISGSSVSRITAPSGSRISGASGSRIAAPGVPRVTGSSTSRIAVSGGSRIPGATASRIPAPGSSRIPGVSISRVAAPGGSQIPGTRLSRIALPSTSRISGASASRIAVPSGSRIARAAGTGPVSRIPSRGRTDITQAGATRVPHSTPVRPYSPVLPEGDASVFFLESPPSYLERSTPPSLKSYEEEPSWPIRTPSPKPSAPCRSIDMADLSAPSLPYRTPSPRAPCPAKTAGPCPGIGTPDLEELKQLGLDAADLADNVFNLDDIQDIRASDMSSSSNLEYEDRPEFEFKDDEMDRELEEWNRKIAEYEAENAEDIALYGSPDGSPVRTLAVEAASPEICAKSSAVGETGDGISSPKPSTARLSVEQAEIARISERVNTLVAVPGGTGMPERDEEYFPYDSSPSWPIRTPSPKPSVAPSRSTDMADLSAPSLPYRTPSPRRPPSDGVDTALPSIIKTLSVVAPPPAVDAASMTLQEIVDAVSTQPLQQKPSIRSVQGSRIPAPGSSKIPGRGSTRIPAPGSGRTSATASSRIPALGGSRIPALGSSRIRAPGRSGIPAPGGSRIISRVAGAPIRSQTPPPYSPELPEGDASVFFLETPPSFIERSTLPSLESYEEDPSWPIRTPSPKPFSSPRRSIDMADLSAPSLPYSTPTPKRRLASPHTRTAAIPTEQPRLDLQELKELGLEAADLDEDVFNLKEIDDMNLSKISVTSEIEYEYLPEFDLQDEEINRDLDQWIRTIAEYEVEHADDIALYGSPEIQAQVQKSPKVTFPDSPGKSPSKAPVRRSPPKQLDAEASPPFILPGSPAAQDIVDIVNRQHAQLVQERLLPSPERAAYRDFEEQERQAITASSPTRRESQSSAAVFTRESTSPARRVNQQLAQVRAPSLSPKHLNVLEEQKRLAVAASSPTRTRRISPERISGSKQLQTPPSRLSEDSLDSFERLEKEYGVDEYAGAAAPIPMPPGLEDVKSAQEAAAKQYQTLKLAELEEEYRKRYKHRRPDMPITPPMFSKYGAVMGQEQKEYDPEEFGEIGDNAWQPAEQFFESKRSLSPRADVRGKDMKPFFRGIERRPEDELFFDQEEQPDLVDLEFESSPVAERSPVATEEEKENLMHATEINLAMQKDSVPAEGGLPVTTPRPSPSPRRPPKSFRVQTEEGEVSFELPPYEEDIFSSTPQEGLYLESPPRELLKSPPPLPSPPESADDLRFRLLVKDEPLYYSKEEMTIPKGRTYGKRQIVKRKSAPPGLPRLRELADGYQDEDVPFIEQIEGAKPFSKPTQRIRVASPGMETVHESPLKVPAFTNADHLTGLRSIVRDIEKQYADLSFEDQLLPEDLLGSEGPADWNASTGILDRSFTEDLPSPIRPPTIIPGWKTPPHLVIPKRSPRRQILPGRAENIKVPSGIRDIIGQEIAPSGMMYSPPQLSPGEYPPVRPPRASPSPRTLSPRAPSPHSPSPQALTIFDTEPVDNFLEEEGLPEDMLENTLSPVRTPPGPQEPPLSPVESPFYLRLRLHQAGEPPYYSKEEMEIPQGRTLGRRQVVKRKSAPPGLHKLRELDDGYREEDVPFLAQVERARPFQKPTRRMRVVPPSVDIVHESPLNVPPFTDADHIAGLRSIVADIEKRHASLLEEPIVPPEDLLGTAAPTDWRPSSGVLDRPISEDLPSPIRPPTIVPEWKTPPHLVIPKRSPRQPLLPGPAENIRVHPSRRTIIGFETAPWDIMYSPPQLLPGEYPPVRPPSRDQPNLSAHPSPRPVSPCAKSPRGPLIRAPSPPVPTIFDAEPADDLLEEEALPEEMLESPRLSVRTPPGPQEPPLSPVESPFYLRLRLLQAGEPQYYSKEEMEIPQGRTLGRRQVVKRKSAPPELHTLRDVEGDYKEEDVPFLAQVEGAQPFPRPTRRIRVTSPEMETVHESPMKVREFTTADHLANMKRLVQDVQKRHPPSPKRPLPEDLMGVEGPVYWQESPGIIERPLPEGLRSPIRPPAVIPGWSTPPQYKEQPKQAIPYQFKLIPTLRDPLFYEMPPPNLRYSPPGGPPQPTYSSPYRSPIAKQRTEVANLPPKGPASPLPRFRTEEELFGQDLQFAVLETPPPELMPAGSPPRSFDSSRRYVVSPFSPRAASPVETPPVGPRPGAVISPTQQLEDMKRNISRQYDQLRKKEEVERLSPSLQADKSLEDFEAFEKAVMAEFSTESRRKQPAPPKSTIDQMIQTGGKVSKQMADLERSPTWLERASAKAWDVPDPHLPRRPPRHAIKYGETSPTWSPELPEVQYDDYIEGEFVPSEVWGYKSPKTPPPSPEPHAAASSTPGRQPVLQRSIFDVEAIDVDYLEEVAPPELARSPTSPPTPPRIDDYYVPHTPTSPGTPDKFVESVRGHEFTDRYHDKDRRLMSDRVRVKNRVVSLSARKRPRVSPIKEGLREDSPIGPPHVPVDTLLPVELFPPEMEMEIVQDAPPLMDRAVRQTNLPFGMADSGLKFDSPPRPPRAATPKKFVYVPGPQYKDELMFQSPPDLYQSPEKDIFEEATGPGILESTPPRGYAFTPPPLSPQESPYSPYMGFTPPSSSPVPKSPCLPCSPRSPRVSPKQSPIRASSPPVSPSFNRSVREHEYTQGFFDRDRPKAQNILRVKNRVMRLPRRAQPPPLEDVEEYDQEDGSPCPPSSPCRNLFGSAQFQLPAPIYYGSPGRVYVRTPTRRTDDPWAEAELVDDDDWPEEQYEVPTRAPFQGQTSPAVMDTSFIDSDLDESFVEEEISGFKWMG